MRPLLLAGLIPPLGFLLGCASYPKADSGPPARLVTGAISPDDRKVINQSEQSVYDTAHMNSPASPDNATPNQGIP